MRNFRKLTTRYAVAFALCSAAISATADSPSTPSQLSALVVTTVPLALSEGVTTLSVQGVRALGKGVELSIKGAGHASEFSVIVPSVMMGGLSVAAGTIVEVTTDGVGHLLHLSGKVIGFIPNELGRSLIRHAPVGPGAPSPHLQASERRQ